MTGAEFSGVDIDLLADYIGGALTGTPEESAVAARIADDPAWSAAFESLSDGMAFVTAELGRFDPEPMPAELAARLDTAFTQVGEPAGEPARSEAEPIADPEPIPAELAGPTPRLTLVHGDLAGGDDSDSVRETTPAPRRGRRLRWVAPIAVAAGVIAFVGFGLDYLSAQSGRSASTSSADTASGAGSAEKAPSLARPLAPAQLLASGTDYTTGTLAIAPPAPLTAPFASPRFEGSAPVRAPMAGVGAALQRLISTAALDDCLTAIEQENGAGALSVESVDYARFAGAPAVIVRFSAGNGHWAWASGASCGTPAGDAATLDKVPVG